MALLCSLPSAHLRSFAMSAPTQYQKLSFYGKAIICFLILFYVCLIALIALITPSRIAQFMYDLAVEIRRLPYGYFIFMATIVLTSFPPFIGHSTLMNLCGFTYGMQGFIPAAISTVLGSALVFVLLRSLFGDRLRKWTATNEKWGVLEAVIRARGLPLIILIRISPFPPWVYSNSLFASIESVSLTQFAFATLFVLPRVMVYVFVGSRIASLSDGEQRSHMDTTTKFINASLIVASILISVIASSVVYYFVQKEIKLLYSSRSTTDGLAAEAREER
ncbi:Golgi apparatus membrane protein TVP38 [Boletus edulis BED1]|uniref:Golgi apparatus membrane protein TVP38 n=1 Tax=Boletus edulis BED1 TaxID=1328754 RepID=A0AAD4GKZ1_BOLED|nr:Golgi apparatus membrane protein TVP38 [Boletus edulis BED1]